MAKRPNGEGTVFFDEKANRYRAQFYDNENKRRNLSAKTKTGIHRKLRDAITARDQGKLTRSPSEIESLGEFLDSWHEIQSKSVWEFKTSENAALDINRYIKPVIGNIRLDSVTPEMIMRAYVKIKETHNLSESSINHVHRILKTAFNSAIKLRKIVVNPMDGVDAPRVRKIQQKVLEEHEILGIINSLESETTQWKALWRITLLTGIRQGEVLGLCWNEVNFENNTIRIVQQLQRQTGKGLVIKRLKTDIEGRSLYLDSETMLILKRWKSEQSIQKLKLKEWGEFDLVFTNSVGRAIEPRRTARKWAELLKRNQIDHIKLHGARHSFATWMIKRGLDLKVVSHYLGHTDIKTTINIYNHITDSSLSSAAALIQNLVSKGA
jgi:integrase